MKPTISELQPLFYRALGKKADITENTTRKNMPLWDSINHINLIMDVQDFYKVAFNTTEIQEIDSVQHLIEILEKKTA
jgi:acyl carrier protein